MGAWGSGPYENDGAADWFANLWEKFALPPFIEKTLSLDVENHHEEIRAAAYVLIQLGQTYSWPVQDKDRHCDLAARKLEAIAKLEIYDDAEFQDELKEEITLLQERISPKYKQGNSSS